MNLRTFNLKKKNSRRTTFNQDGGTQAMIVGYEKKKRDKKAWYRKTMYNHRI